MLARSLNQVLLIWVGVLCTGTTLAAEQGGESPNVFAGTIGNSIVTLIIFGLVVFILGKFAWPHLMRVLAEREQTIQKTPVL